MKIMALTTVCSINTDPENISAITTLAGMGILTDDAGLIDAAVSEVISLPIDGRHQRDPSRDVEKLLVNHYLAEVSKISIAINTSQR